jgi:hypothetical protein
MTKIVSLVSVFAAVLSITACMSPSLVGHSHQGKTFAVGTSPSLVSHIQTGKTFYVVFDNTTDKFNDSEFSGDWRTDPMGTLKGGETYTVFYQNGAFSCEGFNQALGPNYITSYANANPEQKEISLWGRVYEFDEKGHVIDPDYGLVGHILLDIER